MHVLYYSPGACSLAPHIVFEETGIPFEARRVNINDGEHRTAEYRAVNPRQRVPALMIDGVLVTEVPALLMYIASLRPKTKLLPAPGSLDYARCLELCAFLSSTLHVTYAQFRRPERYLPPAWSDPEAFVEHGRLSTLEIYSGIEARLDSRWVLGHEYTIADSYLFPFYIWGPRIGLNMATDCPRWSAWKDRMLLRPAVIRALTREGLALN